MSLSKDPLWSWTDLLNTFLLQCLNALASWAIRPRLWPFFVDKLVVQSNAPDKPMCICAHLSQGTRYVACQNLERLNLYDWPSESETKLHHANYLWEVGFWIISHWWHEIKFFCLERLLWEFIGHYSFRCIFSYWGGNSLVCICMYVCLWASVCVCFCTCVCIHMCVLWSKYGSQKTIFKSPFSASAPGTRDWTQVVDLHFYHLRHLAWFRLIFSNKYCYMGIFKELFIKVL